MRSDVIYFLFSPLLRVQPPLLFGLGFANGDFLMVDLSLLYVSSLTYVIVIGHIITFFFFLLYKIIISVCIYPIAVT